MPRLRRLSAALAALLLLQLSLLGSGTLRESGAMAALGAARMQGMSSRPGMHAHPRAAAPLAQHQGHGGSPSAPAGCDADGGSHDCSLPWSSGSCTTMTACATAAALPALAWSDGDQATRTAELPEPARLRTGPASAPEFPPPRA